MWRPLKTFRLLRKFERERDSVQLNEIAKQLAQLDSPGLRRRLERTLRNHPNVETRSMAAWALGFNSDQRAWRALLEAYEDVENDREVRAWSAEALGHLLACIDFLESDELGWQREFAAELDESVVLALVRGLDDPSPDIRFWSCFALGCIGDESVVERLERLAADDDGDIRGWWPVREEARWAAAQIRGEEYEVPVPYRK